MAAPSRRLSRLPTLTRSTTTSTPGNAPAETASLGLSSSRIARLAAHQEAPVPGGQQRLAHREVRLGALDRDPVGHDRRRALVSLGRAFGGDERIGAHRRHAVLRADGHGLAGEERAEVRLDVGHGGDRRARALHGSVPIDGHACGHGIERVDGRPLQPLQELAGVGAEALHEAALALGVERVERQRRLAGAGDAGDADQLAGLEVEIDALEVVGARAAEPDRVHGGCTSWGRRPGRARPRPFGARSGAGGQRAASARGAAGTTCSFAIGKAAISA